MIFEPIIKAGGIFTLLYIGVLVYFFYYGFLVYKEKGPFILIQALIPVVIICSLLYISASEFIGKSNFDMALSFITIYIFYLIPLFAGSIFTYLVTPTTSKENKE